MHLSWRAPESSYIESLQEKVLAEGVAVQIQVIQIEMSHGSYPIRFEQPTKSPGPSDCANCIRFGSLIF